MRRLVCAATAVETCIRRTTRRRRAEMLFADAKRERERERERERVGWIAGADADRRMGWQSRRTYTHQTGNKGMM